MYIDEQFFRGINMYAYFVGVWVGKNDKIRWMWIKKNAILENGEKRK
jgi:TPR repeat protein